MSENSNPTDKELTIYSELSADWRHRDSLTWQMPAVLIAVVGLLVSTGFELIGKFSPHLIWLIFLFTMLFALCLTAALGQNLLIQGKNTESLKKIISDTHNRFGFLRWGSLLLFILSSVLCLSLILLTVVFWPCQIGEWENPVCTMFVSLATSPGTS